MRDTNFFESVVRIQRAAEGALRDRYGDMDFLIPNSLQQEHEALHEELRRATQADGEVEEAASAVARLMHPHFVKEDDGEKRFASSARISPCAPAFTRSAACPPTPTATRFSPGWATSPRRPAERSSDTARRPQPSGCRHGRRETGLDGRGAAGRKPARPLRLRALGSRQRPAASGATCMRPARGNGFRCVIAVYTRVIGTGVKRAGPVDLNRFRTF